MKILIVDSSVQMIQRLEEILSEAAIDLTIYSTVSYEAAAKLFKENIPDIALLNISLHGTESFTLLKEIKSRLRYIGHRFVHSYRRAYTGAVQIAFHRLLSRQVLRLKKYPLS